ncbi:hypothetical protein [Enterococcus avium]|uniref:hypothetical protein n=1 Tax=Enterococcus avium TaxID=33945 RepID=UPI001F57B1DC|nr:hypothetical protein [Enterococcus avium]
MKTLAICEAMVIMLALPIIGHYNLAYGVIAGILEAGCLLIGMKNIHRKKPTSLADEEGK